MPYRKSLSPKSLTLSIAVLLFSAGSANAQDTSFTRVPTSGKAISSREHSGADAYSFDFIPGEGPPDTSSLSDFDDDDTLLNVGSLEHSDSQAYAYVNDWFPKAKINTAEGSNALIVIDHAGAEETSLEAVITSMIGENTANSDVNMHTDLGYELKAKLADGDVDDDFDEDDQTKVMITANIKFIYKGENINAIKSGYMSRKVGRTHIFAEFTGTNWHILGFYEKDGEMILVNERKNALDLDFSLAVQFKVADDETFRVSQMTNFDIEVSAQSHFLRPGLSQMFETDEFTISNRIIISDQNPGSIWENYQLPSLGDVWDYWQLLW